MPGCACCGGTGRAGIDRRWLLRGAAGLLCTAIGAGTALAEATAGAPRALRIRRLETEETFEGVYWQDGRYDREALKQLDWLLRDPWRVEATPMDPRLFDVMFAVAEELEATEGFEVISGYRSPETNDARARESRRVSRASLHMSGMAADVRLVGRESLGLARAAAELQIGGVGLYRRDGFVHLDCGPARRW